MNGSALGPPHRDYPTIARHRGLTPHRDGWLVAEAIARDGCRGSRKTVARGGLGHARHGAPAWVWHESENQGSAELICGLHGLQGSSGGPDPGLERRPPTQLGAGCARSGLGFVRCESRR
jgi:hypothetical protein